MPREDEQNLELLGLVIMSAFILSAATGNGLGVPMSWLIALVVIIASGCAIIGLCACMLSSRRSQAEEREQRRIDGQR